MDKKNIILCLTIIIIVNVLLWVPYYVETEVYTHTKYTPPIELTVKKTYSLSFGAKYFSFGYWTFEHYGGLWFHEYYFKIGNNSLKLADSRWQK